MNHQFLNSKFGFNNSFGGDDGEKDVHQFGQGDGPVVGGAKYIFHRLSPRPRVPILFGGRAVCRARGQRLSRAP